MKTIKNDTEQRRRIVDTALRLFFKQGYLATGVNQIIDEADVCKATFYSNFPSKEDLCLAYINTSHDHWLELLQAQVGQGDGSYAQIMAVFDFLKNWMNGCEYRGCGLMNIATEVPQTQGRIRALVKERNDLLKSKITALFANLQRNDPRFAKIPVESLSDFFLILIQGAIASSQASADAKPIEAARKSFETLMASYAAK